MSPGTTGAVATAFSLLQAEGRLGPSCQARIPTQGFKAKISKAQTLSVCPQGSFCVILSTGGAAVSGGLRGEDPGECLRGQGQDPVGRGGGQDPGPHPFQETCCKGATGS